MYKRWNKVDLLIGLLAVLTAIAYFLFSPDLFKFIFWITIISALGRVLILLRRKFFWKIQNRLIFSGIFLVVTPIFFISLFFILILNVVIIQYGTVFLENIINDQTKWYEEMADNFLTYDDPQMIPIFVMGYLKHDPQFNAIFWSKPETEKKYKFSLQYSGGINDKKLIVLDFKGFFLLDNKLYLGILKSNRKLAVLIANEIDQFFLDKLCSASDLKVQFRIPGTNPALKIAGNPGNQASIIPYMYEYNYLDFDIHQGFKPTQRHSDFLLSSNYKSFYKRFNAMISHSTQGTVKKVIIILIVLFSTFIIISLFIGFRMIRVITRSINQMTYGTQRIRNGDFSFRIKTRTGDQLQYLAECFNEMAAGIDRLLVDVQERHRLEEELRIARSIQLKLLPPEIFNPDEFEIAAVNIPATEIAGDYFDYFYSKNEYLSILVADVAGKGSSAAFYMAELKGVINHLHRKLIPPAVLISECHYSLKESFDRVTFITINIAQFRIPEKKFVVARAGHTPALFYNSQNNTCIEIHPQGVAIGLINFSCEKIHEMEFSYHPGDILVLFSDGLTEIQNENDDMLGIHRLKTIICQNSHLSALEIKKIILDFSIEFSGDSISRDDLTFIVLKVK